MLSSLTIYTLIALSSADWEDPGGVSWDGITGMKVYKKGIEWEEALCPNEESNNAPCQRDVDGVSYYGPFDNSKPWFIERRLACSLRSTVSVTYSVTTCNCDESSQDHTRVYLDYFQGDKMSITLGGSTAITDDALSHLSCGTSYEQVEEEVSISDAIRVVLPGETFAFKIKVRVNGATEIAYLSHIAVTCNAVSASSTTTTPAPSISSATTHDEYCIQGLPYDGSTSRDGEFVMVTTNAAEDPLLKNSKQVFENYNRNTRVFLYALTDRWVLASGARDELDADTVTQFAQCDPWATGASSYAVIAESCGCATGAEEHECTKVKTMDDEALSLVFIKKDICDTGHIVIESETADVLPVLPMFPFELNMNDTKEVMQILIALCVMSFILGMFTLYVCNMVFKRKNKSYQKVGFKNVEDDEEELEDVLA